MPDSEGGLKWWLRYVIVPVIGGGGIIAIWVSVREHPSAPAAAPQNVTSSTLPNNSKPNAEHPPNRFDDSVEFYASSALEQHEEHDLKVKQGETVLLHWNVQNFLGAVYLNGQSVDGNEQGVEVARTGHESIKATKTMDYSLEMRYYGNNKTIATLRVSVIP
jgi:hypothetical protein